MLVRGESHVLHESSLGIWVEGSSTLWPSIHHLLPLTHSPELNDLNQHWLSRLVWSELGRGFTGAFGWGSPGRGRVGQAAVSPLKAQPGKELLPCSLSHVAVRMGASQAVGPRASVPTGCAPAAAIWCAPLGSSCERDESHNLL